MMPGFERLDSLTVTVVAEDSVLYESPYWGQHGLCLYLEAVRGGSRMNILVDVAQDADAVAHNIALLGIDPASVDAIVLTHCHYDHTRGVTAMLKAIGKRELPVVAHTGLFRPSFVVEPSRQDVGMGSADSRSAMEEAGGRLVLSGDPVVLMPGLATTGYVPRRTGFEAAGTGLKTLDGEGRTVDDTMDDDISVAAAVGNQGLVIATGCSHAGIVNIVRRAKGLTAIDRVAGIVGGLHLVEAPMERIRKTVDALCGLEVATVYAGHCTGFDAQVELRAAFGARFQPLRTGQRLLFGAGAPGLERE